MPRAERVLCSKQPTQETLLYTNPKSKHNLHAQSGEGLCSKHLQVRDEHSPANYNYTPKAERNSLQQAPTSQGRAFPCKLQLHAQRHLQVRDEHSPANYNYTPRAERVFSLQQATTTYMPRAEKGLCSKQLTQEILIQLTQSLSTTYMPRAEKGLCSKQPTQEILLYN